MYIHVHTCTCFLYKIQCYNLKIHNTLLLFDYYCMFARVSHYPAQSTLEAEPHVIPDFVVSSATATVRHVISNGTIQDVRNNYALDIEN